MSQAKRARSPQVRTSRTAEFPGCLARDGREHFEDRRVPRMSHAKRVRTRREPNAAGQSREDVLGEAGQRTKSPQQVGAGGSMNSCILSSKAVSSPAQETRVPLRLHPPLGLNGAPRDPLERPRWPKMAPRGPQRAHDGLQEDSRYPKRAQYGVRPPAYLREVQSQLQNGSKCLEGPSGHSQDATISQTPLGHQCACILLFSLPMGI